MATWRAYSKAGAAIIGAGVTAGLGIVTPDTELYNVLTIVSAMLTAFAVYAVPNKAGDDARTAG